MKKTFVMTAGLALLLLLAACGTEKPTEPADTLSTAGAASAETEPAAPVYLDSLPEDMDLGGYNIRMLGGLQFGVDPEEAVDIVSDLLYRRQLTVEDRLNCHVTDIEYDGDGWNVFVSLVRKSVMAGQDDYDVVCGNLWWASPLSFTGYLLNLRDAPNIDLSQPWWGTDFIKGMGCGDIFYWLTGNLDTSWTSFKMCNFFNKKMWEAHYEDFTPYDLVREGKWTLDKLREVTIDIYSDINGNGAYDDDQDVFGFGVANDMMVESYAVAAGVKVAPLGSDGMPYVEIAYDPQRIIDFWTKFWPLKEARSYCHIDYNRSEFSYFAAGRILVTTGWIANIEDSLRSMEDDFGILPLPKLNESQENYITAFKDSVAIYGIPTTVSEEGLNAGTAMMEAAAAYGYQFVAPAYYEDCLKNKYIRDEDSIEMIDLMAGNPVSDFGVQYIDFGFCEFIEHGVTSSDIASKIEKRAAVFQRKLDTMLEKMKDN